MRLDMPVTTSLVDMQTKTLHEATSTSDLLAAEHPHIGRVAPRRGLTVPFGILTATNRKLESIDARVGGKLESVALHVDASRFMVTIAKSFVLLTLLEGKKRRPVIQKKWRRIDRKVGKDLTAFFGTEDTYLDQDNLKWEHRYKRPGEPDELSAYDASGLEALLLSLETPR